MTRLVIVLATLAVVLVASPASARCFKFQNGCTEATSTGTSRTYIVNQNRQKIGDLYSPGHGRRVQIRDNDRRILFYIEKDGTITDTRRRKVGTVEGLSRK